MTEGEVRMVRGEMDTNFGCKPQGTSTLDMQTYIEK
jgi:hypothetical protein